MANVRYMVNDVEQAIAFYVGQLGFEVKEQWGPAFAMIAKDDLTIWLSGPQTSAAKPMPDGRQPLPGGWNRIVIQVDDLEATVAHLAESGTVFRNMIVNGMGGKQILAEDPSGNPIELFEAGQ
jgi:catechol 2,3-dioxygenase-like lactoylglutathione lyase family enzyme